MHPDGLRAALPDGNAVLELPVEELAGVLLHVLARPNRDRLSSLGGFCEEVKNWPDLNRGTWGDAHLALAEAWSWLITQGLIVNSPSQPHNSTWMELTRRGRRVAKEGSFADYLKASLFSRGLLHPRISESAWATYIRGDYDTAVFQAFKLVEVAVRSAGGFDAKMVGTVLMRAAFDKNTGPLTDMSLPEAEREALAHLFAGAIGSYKNPHSHRTVVIEDPQEAGEMLMMASHLLRIVEYRQPA